MTGYAHQAYARSLAAFGAPLWLPQSQGWLLARKIPGSDLTDAMGPYPLFACSDWSSLSVDLERLGADLLTLALVPDPFGAYDRDFLERCFDGVCHFKDRYVVELGRTAEEIGSRHHRYHARKARSMVSVEHCPFPHRFAEEWICLYAGLIRRHGLQGIKAFSREGLAQQLLVPGMEMFRALHRGRPVGMHLWYVQGRVAYSHLTAMDDAGYRLGASYALHSFAIDWFSSRVRWLDLGAGAGTAQDPADGLSRFKRGWSTGTRPSYFCTRVFDRGRYSRLMRERGSPATRYFPAYRAGEFA